MGPDQESARWRARIGPPDAVTGVRICAGIMLDQHHVLTCAHAILDLTGIPPESQIDAVRDVVVEVRLPHLPGMPSAPARVDLERWAPLTSDGGGDLAVLRLERPITEAAGAPLRRSELDVSQNVRAFGFPAGADHGYWAAGELAGSGGPGGIWVQLAGEAITSGFSGAAAIDEAGQVIGICVAKLTGSALQDSFMIPVEAMPGILPDLRQWIQGPKAADESFAATARADRGSHEAARRIADWLGRAGAGEVEVVLTGAAGSAAAGALGNSVVLADREQHSSAAGILAGLPADAVPAVGSVDLAVDASGRTVEQVRARIRDRLGIDVGDASRRPRPRSRPRTLVITEIDAARDPDALAAAVVQPLIRHAHRWQLRLILGFRAESPQWRLVRAAVEDVPSLLARLEEEVGDLETAEAGVRELHDHLSRRIAGLPDVPHAAALHRPALRLLQETDDPAWVRARMQPCLHAVDRDARALNELRADLDRAHRRRDELRGLLSAYRRVAADTGIEQQLSALHEDAAHELWEKRCDLPAAAERVHRYVRAVLQGSGG